jgi:hypothetical protein
MSRSLRSGDVAIGLLTENTKPMLAQAIRLVRSIRWFGGGLAKTRIVVCGVGTLERGARETLESYGVELRTVTRFHPANPTGNRLQLLAELLDAPEEMLFVLDCDTLVVRDPLPYLNAGSFQAKIAPTPTVNDEVFERLFTHFDVAKPPRAHVTPFDGTPTIPYFNSGVIAIPTRLARMLVPAWRRFNLALAEQPELAAPCQRHMHQAALALALAETGIPVAELPAAMNFQLNATHVAAPPGYAETDPAILHYHHLATDDGFLLPTPYPAAQARIELFHERMLAEGIGRERAPRIGAAESRPIVILGMHRSGTSVIAQLVHALGAYAGQPDELAPPDMFNPTGYWEHREVVQLDTDILDELHATWTDVEHANLAHLSPAARAAFVTRAKNVVRSLEGRGPFVLKDPRMALLFPLWREALREPVAVIAWRDPAAVARSIAKRDQRPLLASIALWEHYNRTLLRDSEGMPRVLVAYDELLADPMRVARQLCDQLASLGIHGVKVPSEERMRQIVKADFNRSGAANDPSLLDGEQRALLESLRSGAALREPVAPTSARSRALLAQVRAADENDATLRERIADLEMLLNAVFASRSWRLGHSLTGVLRARRRRNVTALDRLEELKNRPV